MEAKTVVLYCFLSLFCTTIAEKRILTNEPQYIHGIEAQFQSLTQQFRMLQTDNQALELKVQELNSLKGGGVYTRWGHTTCPASNTELVYSGYAGGSWYDHSGGAAEYVCLPKDPINHTYFTLANEGYMYGAEYYGGSLNDQDVPCAVCRSSVYSSIVMIPARDQCYPGWVEQYHGMLSSGHHLDETSQYVCLDAKPETLPHGYNNENGRLFETVISKCGSLPCPPYTNNAQLSCVVCAK